jgi:hypothetical protein
VALVIPEVDELVDHLLRHERGRIGRLGGERVDAPCRGDASADLVELVGGEHEPVGRDECRLELRGLEVTIPALVKALPLPLVAWQVARALEPQPLKPADLASVRGGPYLDRDRAQHPRPGDRCGDLLLRPVEGRRVAAPRPRFGLGLEADHRPDGGHDGEQDEVVVGAWGIEGAGHPQRGGSWRGALPHVVDAVPELEQAQALRAGRVDLPEGKAAGVLVVEGLEERLG